ncbi:DgyrCDS1865 [Dimorphilus gyrociliatus]|uniref:DgyrCDS1865 n=1 Tax=Dimorphilus gyrociliatus TaxID=2664684 RepID=A0A7I8VAE2_9ANNE|nr:DgyrCDS1865 [Dimorphilus gyrociliatus]
MMRIWFCLAILPLSLTFKIADVHNDFNYYPDGDEEKIFQAIQKVVNERNSLQSLLFGNLVSDEKNYFRLKTQRKHTNPLMVTKREDDPNIQAKIPRIGK